MKNWAIVALCFFSSLASANDFEEVVVKARQVKVVLEWKLAENHKQNPITGNWHYVEKEQDSKTKA
jgi:hypothetical protein